MAKKLLIDFNNLAIRTLFASHNHDWATEGFSFHKHLVLNTLISDIKKFDPDEVILAVDDIRNWRKKVYPEYKANRKIQREALDFDWDAYFNHINIFTESLKLLPFKILTVPYTEADDIIAVLSKYFINTENIIVSSDRDYIQLLQYKQNKLWNPIDKKFIICDSPLKALEIKKIIGDSGDNVPAIKPRMGEKTAIKLLETGKFQELLDSDKQIKENYIRNSRMISLSEIPDIIQKEIVKRYQEYQMSETVSCFNWLSSHGLRALMDKAQQIEMLFDKFRKPLPRPQFCKVII